MRKIIIWILGLIVLCSFVYSETPFNFSSDYKGSIISFQTISIAGWVVYNGSSYNYFTDSFDGVHTVGNARDSFGNLWYCGKGTPTISGLKRYTIDFNNGSILDEVNYSIMDFVADGCSIDWFNNIWITSQATQQIHRLDYADNYSTMINYTLQPNIFKSAVDGFNNIYVTSVANNSYSFLNYSDNYSITTYYDICYQPFYAVVDKFNDIWMTCTGNNASNITSVVLRINTTTGKEIERFFLNSQYGNNPDSARGICSDFEGNLYVGDDTNDFYFMNRSDNYSSRVVFRYGTADEDLTDCAINSDGNIYLTDKFPARRVFLLNATSKDAFNNLSIIRNINTGGTPRDVTTFNPLALLNFTSQLPVNDTTPPIVTITFPANNSNITIIKFNGSLIMSLDEIGNCTLNSSDYDLSFTDGQEFIFQNNTNISYGNYTISYFCIDAANNSNNGTWNFNYVYLDIFSPIITIFYPNNNSQLNNYNGSIVFNTDELTTCFLNDTKFTATTNNLSYNYNNNTFLDYGDFNMSIDCRDNLFNWNNITLNWFYYLQPQITLLYPPNNSVYTNSSPFNGSMNYSLNKNMNCSISLIPTFYYNINLSNDTYKQYDANISLLNFNMSYLNTIICNDSIGFNATLQHGFTLNYNETGVLPSEGVVVNVSVDLLSPFILGIIVITYFILLGFSYLAKNGFFMVITSVYGIFLCLYLIFNVTTFPFILVAIFGLFNVYILFGFKPFETI